MFDGFRRLVGAIQIKQTETEIIINGIPADVMARDISRIWGTSRITTNMFTHMSKNSLSFPLFFAPDIFYAIEQMLLDRSRRVSARVLNHIKDLLATETWLAKTLVTPKGRLNLSKLSDMVLTPLDFQMDFINAYNTILDQYGLKGFLLAGTAGSGKTFTSLAVAHCLEADLIVVVSPKNAVERVWETNINSFFKKPPNYWMAHKGLMVKGNERIIIGHYEAMHILEDAMITRMRQLGGSCKVVVILDESHNINEISSLRTQRFIDLAAKSRSDNVIWLSGTPIKALGSESIPLFRCIDSYFTKDVEERFRKIYGKDGKKGLDILQHRLGIVSFKVEKSALNLLDPIITSVKIKIPTGHKYTLAAVADDMRKYVTERRMFYAKTIKQDTQRFYEILDKHASYLTSKEDKDEYGKYRNMLMMVINAYDKADLSSVTEESVFCNKYEKKISGLTPKEVREDFRHIKSIVKYVDLKIQGECLGRVLGRKRIECHVDMVPYVDFMTICDSTAKKTIVFTSFVDVLKEAERFTRSNGLNPVVVYGETNSGLTSIIKDFESNVDTNPLIATYNSLSTAIPLIMADTMIMLNAPFRSYIDEQAISRIHRLDADSQTYVYRVILDTGNEPNLSTRSEDILKWSQEMVSAIMGIKSPFEITSTEALESFSEEPLFTIAAESYDVTEVVTLDSLRDISKVPGFAGW